MCACVRARVCVCVCARVCVTKAIKAKFSPLNIYIVEKLYIICFNIPNVAAVF